jgi:uncharacterized protein (DUF58 family)
VTLAPRTAVVIAGLAVLSLVLPTPLVVLMFVALVGAVGADAWRARRAPVVTRALPRIVVRGVPAELRLDAVSTNHIRLRQPRPPEVEIEPAQADSALRATVIARRRGRHVLPAPASRVTGPLGLGAWTHRSGDPSELVVYPDLPGARRLAASVRRGRLRDEGRRRGPLGLGTEFEAVRDYLPDDDIRHVNWRASARLGRPMSNQFRVERDRDVVCIVDCGRLMAAPAGSGTRLDAAIDAAVAVSAVAEELGDRCGTLAFAGDLLRTLSPRRRGTDAIVRALFDLEPVATDSDYERAFRWVGGAKHAFVLVLTDVLDEAAAQPLLDALPVLARRHTVAVAAVADSDLQERIDTEPAKRIDVFRAAVALDVLATRRRTVTLLRRAGADVVEAPPAALPAACVRAYLRAKSQGLL